MDVSTHSGYNRATDPDMFLGNSLGPDIIMDLLALYITQCNQHDPSDYVVARYLHVHR